MRFRRYKGFRDFSIHLDRVNVLVGPNNSGKSTVIGAFRLLALSLARARARKPERIQTSDGVRYGYWLPTDALPTTVENVHTNYLDEETTVTFRLTDSSELVLLFPADGGACLIPRPSGRLITNTGEFRRAFPVTVGVVPVLSSFEDTESPLGEAYVARSLHTHLAARHFRNYWYYDINDFTRYGRDESRFEEFRALLKVSWPGVDIKPPEMLGSRLAMFCMEGIYPREIFWAGFGFQIWCQLLTHVLRCKGDTLLVVDEPEIYLHPELQRRFLQLVRDAGPDVLLATHSSEIVTECEASELVVIDKDKASGKRFGSTAATRRALQAIGSGQNVVLTQLARNRRVLFVEGEDFKTLRGFARKLRMLELANAQGVSVFPLGGFPDAGNLSSLCHGIEATLGASLPFAGVFDRDYRPASVVNEVCSDHSRRLAYVHIYARKELENYLLTPAAIDRALAQSASQRMQRTGMWTDIPSSAILLLSITDGMRAEAQAQITAQRLRVRGGIDEASVMIEVGRELDAIWPELHTRLEVLPGKEVLTRLNERLQDQCGLGVTAARIVDAFTVDEVPNELRQMLMKLDEFRKTGVSASD